MQLSKSCLYSRSHEWAEINGATARVGLSDHAQDAMGSFVYVSLPEVGDALQKGDVLGEVESVKAVSEVYAPVSGTVKAINEALLDAPENINEDPYGAWLVELENVEGQEDLMSADAYEAFCKEEA